VAYVNDVPAGCGAIKQYDDNIAEVKRMLVKSDFRGQQIAARILEQLERWTVELGFDRCTLETGAGSKALCPLYKKCGYNITPN
jgi:putative acetyltransferase